MNKSFWKDKKVLVTGHTGFKGSWLSTLLFYLGSKVYGYSLPPLSTPNLYDKIKLKDILSGEFLNDIRDFHKIKEFINDIKPDVIFHLAAQPLVISSYINPRETYDINIMGTVNILENIRNCNYIQSAVIVTSDKCYRNNEWLWSYRENDILGGIDPYSASKACAELIVDSYRRIFEDNSLFPLHTVRAGNVIGGGDWAEFRLVPDIIRAQKYSKKIKIRYPNSIRPWQHVLDALSGYIKLAELKSIEVKESGSSWNFGPSDFDNISVINLIKLFKEKISFDYEIEIPTIKEMYSLKLDTSKARSLLLWKPKLSLNDSIDLTIDWYLKNEISNSNMMEITLNQIEKYYSL